MDWENVLALFQADHLGNPEAELSAVRSASILVPLFELGIIRASGPDSPEFLHNLLTNDIRHLAPDGIRRAGLCTPKGRLIASFEIWREGEDFLLFLSRDILPAIHKKLSMYILRSKVKLSDASADWALLGITGPLVAELCGEQPAMSSMPWRAGRLLRLDERRAMIALPTPEAAAAWRELQSRAQPAGMAAWRLAEIAAGIPRIVAATQEAFVPQMVNYELPQVAGVSFQKGCYPGQEIVARTHYLGKVKRRMFRARMAQFFPAGSEVFTPELGEQHCGALVLTAPAPEGGWECLAVAPISAKEADAVHVGALSGPKLEFLPLPYTVD